MAKIPNDERLISALERIADTLERIAQGTRRVADASEEIRDLLPLPSQYSRWHTFKEVCTKLDKTPETVRKHCELAGIPKDERTQSYTLLNNYGLKAVQASIETKAAARTKNLPKKRAP